MVQVSFEDVFLGSPLGDHRCGATTRGLRGRNDILAAAERGSVGAVRHIVRTVPGAAAATDVFGYTALHWALIEDHVEVCRVLLAAGAPLDARDVSGLLAEDCDAGRRCRRGTFLLDLAVFK